MPSAGRSKNENQASPLPGLQRFITGHDPSTGKSVMQNAQIAPWQFFDDNKMGFNAIYTTSETPTDLNADADITKHDQVMASGSLGLVNPGGTVCRIVDVAPGYTSLMHRTQSIDYGVVLEGEVELLLDENYDVDSGKELKEIPVMRRGDVAVQRGTMHGWRNHSKTEWVRMLFVLTEATPLTIGGKKYGEDLGVGVEGLPKSGNA
jgi:hypothetical protein